MIDKNAKKEIRAVVKKYGSPSKALAIGLPVTALGLGAGAVGFVALLPTGGIVPVTLLGIDKPRHFPAF